MIFVVQVLISFFVGGLFIAAQTIFSERLPLKWRAAILGLPGTLSIGLLFIGLTKTTLDVSESTKIIPAILGVEYLLIVGFVFFSKRGLMLASFAGLTIWAIAAAVVLRYPPHSFINAVFIGAPIIIITYLLISKLPQQNNISPVAITKKILIIRTLASGTLIATAVILSHVLGNTWGILFSMFPAAFSSTLLIYYFTYGPDVVPAISKAMFFPGAIGICLYGFVAGWAFHKYGIWLGTLMSYAISLSFYYLYAVIKDKIKTAY